jgi:[ribosomal protein S18]-alanine N-acetyltransferase
MNEKTPSISPAFRVRLMKEEDLEQVKKIDKMSFVIPWPERSYDYEFYRNPLSLLFVAELEEPGQNNPIIGAIVMWLIVDEAHIATIAVHPEHRQKGVAKELLAKSLKTASEKGMQQATLEVRANNTSALRLYKHFGFEIIGRRKRYYRDNNEDALIMTLNKIDHNA